MKISLWIMAAWACCCTGCTRGQTKRSPNDEVRASNATEATGAVDTAATQEKEQVEGRADIADLWAEEGQAEAMVEDSFTAAPGDRIQRAYSVGPDGKLTYTGCTLYAAKGHKLRLKAGGMQWLYDYNAYDSLVKSTIVYSKGQVEVQETFAYNDQRQLVEAVRYSNGKPSSTTTYAYDTAGRLIKTTQKGKDHSTVSVNIYEGDVLVEHTYTSTSSGYSSTGRTRYIYDGRGRKIKTELYNGSKKIEEHSTYEYDAQGNLTCDAWRNGKGEILHKTLMAYDSKGRLVKTKCEPLGREDYDAYDPPCDTEFKYNENGDLVEEDGLMSHGVFRWETVK